MGRFICEILTIVHPVSIRAAATLVAVAIVAVPQPKAGAQSYEGTGELSFSWFSPTNVHEESSRFEFRVNDGRWWIKLVPTSHAIPDYREAAFDGTTVYVLESVESIVKMKKAAGERVGYNIATSFLQEGGEILHDVSLDEIPAIWLTFCSGSFFKRQTNAMTEPAITFGQQPQIPYHQLSFKQKALWTLHESLPYTPKEVRYIADGWIHLPPREPVRRAEPFHDGFTNVVFKADRFTNIDSLTLPETATIETFRPGTKGDDGQKLRTASQYKLKLLSAKRTTGSGESFTPRIPGPTHITDNRFYVKAGSLSYLITNSWSERRKRR